MTRSTAAAGATCPGDDVIRARRGDQDAIDCGDGTDIAIVDASEDGVYDCEDVRRPAGAP